MIVSSSIRSRNIYSFQHGTPCKVYIIYNTICDTPDYSQQRTCNKFSSSSIYYLCIVYVPPRHMYIYWRFMSLYTPGGYRTTSITFALSRSLPLLSQYNTHCSRTNFSSHTHWLETFLFNILFKAQMRLSHKDIREKTL